MARPARCGRGMAPEPRGDRGLEPRSTYFFFDLTFAVEAETFVVAA